MGMPVHTIRNVGRLYAFSSTSPTCRNAPIELLEALLCKDELRVAWKRSLYSPGATRLLEIFHALFLFYICSSFKIDIVVLHVGISEGAIALSTGSQLTSAE